MSMSSKDLQHLALQLADEGFDERVRILAEASAKSPYALTDAARALTGSGAKAGTRQHVAFTYLSAAFQQLTGSD